MSSFSMILVVLAIIFSIVGLYMARVRNKKLQEELVRLLKENYELITDTPTFSCKKCNKPLTNDRFRAQISSCRLGEVCEPVLRTKKDGEIHIPSEFIFLTVVRACREKL